MANLKRRRAELIRGLLGYDGAPQSVVTRGMAKVKKTTEQRFRELIKQQASRSRANAPLGNHLLSSLRNDPAWLASIRKRRGEQKSPRKRRISLPGINVVTQGLTFSPFYLCNQSCTV